MRVMFVALIATIGLVSHAFTVPRTKRAVVQTSVSMSSKTINIFRDETTKQTLELLEDGPTNFKVALPDQLKLMKATDIALADNYWEGTLPKTTRNRMEAAKGKDTLNRIKVDETYYSLMNTGFDRRFAKEKRSQSQSYEAGRLTSMKLELGKSKEEQLAAMKKKKLDERSKLMKFVPSGLQKYVDYATSLYKKPSKDEMMKSVLFGTFFSFIVWVNTSARSSFMYYVIGNLMLCSALLTRNMPTTGQVAPGQGRSKVATWSSNSFRTALALTLLSTISTALLTVGLTTLLRVPVDVRFKAAMMVSIIASSMFTTCFEVFESKEKPGSRWKKAMEGNLPADMEAKLAKEMTGNLSKGGDLYDYAYNPQIDDYPPLPKYLDEVERGGGVAATAAGELDEDESKEHFDKWRQWRKDARRPPVEDAPPETPWVGSKEGMYVSNVPTWLTTAYKAHVLKANRWRDTPTKFIKDNSEFELIPGPLGFRDKFPEWLSMFGTGVWEEKTTLSRKAARAFGTYRKTMWTVDPKVVLLPCDGADKDQHVRK